MLGMEFSEQTALDIASDLGRAMETAKTHYGLRSVNTNVVFDPAFLAYELVFGQGDPRDYFQMTVVSSLLAFMEPMYF
jgi:hypothetical protein